jgi:hypothetical protein
LGRVISRASAILTFSPQTHRLCGAGSGVSGCGPLGLTMPDKHIRGFVHFTPGEPHQRRQACGPSIRLRGSVGASGLVAGGLSGICHGTLRSVEPAAARARSRPVFSFPASVARGIVVGCGLEARAFGRRPRQRRASRCSLRRLTGRGASGRCTSPTRTGTWWSSRGRSDPRDGATAAWS